MVLKAPVTLNLSPNTLIWPGDGIVNSSVPRRCAVTKPYRSARLKDLWPMAGSVIVSDKMTTPASLLMEIAAVTAYAEMFARPMAVEEPLVLSNGTT